MELEKRIDLLLRLSEYIQSDDANWEVAKQRAMNSNAWFTEENIQLAIDHITRRYLHPTALRQWVEMYHLPVAPQKVGIVMAGNIPLVGFHDFLCGFISGHTLHLKLSSKDEWLMRQIINQLIAWDPALSDQIIISEQLKNATAYIATGSNNSARYFEQYFGKYPHIIRQNRTSVAILDGTETTEDFHALAKDVFSYFGLGCRNVTQLCVPKGYVFDQLLETFSEYRFYMDHHKYKNNYDYHLAIYLLNKIPCLTNEVVLLVENELPFSAVSVLHYRYYTDKEAHISSLETHQDIQAIVCKEKTPFGRAQFPALTDYADGVDTMNFLCDL